MPDRYWVGGTANWDGTAGTKWSATSGGAGGASVPTTADDVFFTNLSTGTCTIATGNTGARSINCTGFAGTITGSAAITVAGSVTLVAAMTYTHTGTMTFTGTGTLTTAGKVFSSVTVNGAGITLTLGDALNTGTRTLTVTQGTFTTNNFSVAANALSSSNSNVRTINIGSSAISLSTTGAAINFGTSTNLTFNAGTSQINLTGSLSPDIDGGAGQTFNNLSFTSAGTTTGSSFIGGPNTFNNLTFAAPSSSGLISFNFGANQTINGTFTCAGASALRRVFIASNVTGAARTLTVGTLSANDCDFRDIVLAGAASPASPTRAGDCGGNSNITFPVAKTVYRVGTASGWGGSNSWATSSGGTGADNNFPLAQDTAIIDNNASLPATLTISDANISEISASTRTLSITLSTFITSFYGSVSLGSGVTVSGTGLITFSGRGTMDFTSAGKTLTFPIAVDAPGGTFRLLDALTMSAARALTHANGTINLNGFNLTVGTAYQTAAGVKNLTFNGGTLTCPAAGSTAFNNVSPTGFTTTAGAGAGTINMTAATAKTFVGGGSTFNCTLNNGGAGALTITGSNTFATLANSVQPTSFLFTAGTTTTLTNWAINGTAGNLVTINSVTAASHTLSKASGTVSADYLSISRSTAAGGAAWYAGANSTDGGNNSGWIFAAGAIVATLAQTLAAAVLAAVGLQPGAPGASFGMMRRRRRF